MPPSPLTLAFDVYGTLIDTRGITAALTDMIGGQAPAFSQTWRDKQLEYAFRRGLMRRYDTFAVCTAQALNFTCAAYQVDLSERQKSELLDAYSRLPPFTDVQDGLQQLQTAGHRLFAFSNGSRAAVEALLSNAGLRDFFIACVSVDDIKTFKPDPAVYAYFLQQAAAAGSAAWLVSGNPFDVIGAVSAGLKAAWVRRSSRAVFDPWGMEPTLTITRLTDLPARLAGQETTQSAG